LKIDRTLETKIEQFTRASREFISLSRKAKAKPYKSSGLREREGTSGRRRPEKV